MPAHEHWQPDPTSRHQKRWRREDGTWGDQVSDGGVVSRDPYTGPQPDLDAPEPPALEGAHPEPAAVPVPRAAPVHATTREPLSFWQHAWATAFGIALSIPVLIAGAAVAITLLSETTDWP